MDKIEHIGIAINNLEQSNELFSSLFGRENYKVEEVLIEEGKLGRTYYLTEEIAGSQDGKIIAEYEIDGNYVPVSVYDASKDMVLVMEGKSYV